MGEWQYREALGRSLSQLPEFEVLIAASLDEGTAVVGDTPPDVAIVDLQIVPGQTTMPPLPCCPESAVIVLTVSRDLDHFRRALLAGVRGYAFKEDLRDPNEVVQAVREVLNGGTYFSGEGVRRMLEQLAGSEKPTRRPYGLTAREIEVLALVSEGLSNKQIGERLVLSEQAIKNHVGHILHKLDAPNRTTAAIIARRDGLVSDQPVTFGS